MTGRGGRPVDDAATGDAIADVIVVAAGASRRMGGIDKLAATIAGRPLLAWTVDAMAAAPVVDRVVVVTAPGRRDELAAAPWLSDRVSAVVAGGERRQDSVRAGFVGLESLLPDAAGSRVVLVHDGARPMASAGLIERVTRAAAEHGAAIPVLPIAETVKRIEGERVGATLERSELAVAQTPQGVRRDILRDALAQVAGHPSAVWTDEAALLEACRIAVHVVDGEPDNIKVTVPADLARAERLVGDRADRRTGIGHDSHAFGPGSPLRLGGVEFAGVPRLTGHSDGDVALHAVADALLGSAGLGDLGRLFPAGPSTPVGIDSRELLGHVVAKLHEAGWRPVAVDLTIVGARPRLGDRLSAMGDAIAERLGIPASSVNVKASSGNLDGAEGAGRSISALAVATIGRG